MSSGEKRNSEPGVSPASTDVDNDKVTRLVELGNQLVADRAGLEQRHIVGQSSVLEGINKVNTETIVPEKQIARRRE